jgi:hypothetical protein
MCSPFEAANDATVTKIVVDNAPQTRLQCNVIYKFVYITFIENLAVLAQPSVDVTDGHNRNDGLDASYQSHSHNIHVLS